MKILIVSGSKGKFFHLKAFGEALKKMNVEYRLVKESEYGKGFPSKDVKSWFRSGQKFKKLIDEFEPDCVFIDRQARVGVHTINAKIPLFVLLRGHYWSEIEWAKKTIVKNPITRLVLQFRNNMAEKCFSQSTAVFPICRYLVDIVKKHHPNQNTHVFFEGIDSTNWYSTNSSKLKHPCIGLLQDANWWGKTKEMLVLKKALKEFPEITFYWVGDGTYREKITSELKQFKNFEWLSRMSYPDEVRDFLSEIDIYALITGMDTAPLTLKEAQLMKKPVIATDVGGVNEMMVDKKTGFLVKEGNADDLVEKIKLLMSDKAMAKEMGIHGREFVEETFSWNVIAQKFLASISNYVKR